MVVALVARGSVRNRDRECDPLMPKGGNTVKKTNGDRPYETPRVETYTSDELLQKLGPALAVYGPAPGGP